MTPDSFSDGGHFQSVDEARRRIERLVSDGADVIDIGGESTRPGATPVSATEEIARVLPVVEACVRDHPGVPVSVDTVKATVAAAALDVGASIANDVSGLRLDSEMAPLCARTRAGVVIMHSRGDVADMASFANAEYGDDVVGDVASELRVAVDRAVGAGVGNDSIVLDPGIGFAKRASHSLAVLAGIPRLASLGFPVLVGASRKRFIGDITGTSVRDRDGGTVGANVAALMGGAMLFRVHDVKANRQALDVAWAVLGARSAR